VNHQIINLKYRNKVSPYQLGDHTTVCYCPQSSHHNCSVHHLSPSIYPGQLLTVELCLPNNKEEGGILYSEAYNVNLPKSFCETNDNGHISHIFNGGLSRMVEIPIVSEQPGVCELFLTASPNLFYYYDVFNIHLLSCPLGFMLQHGVCDCDPYLKKYIGWCSIDDQKVIRHPMCIY